MYQIFNPSHATFGDKSADALHISQEFQHLWSSLATLFTRFIYVWQYLRFLDRFLELSRWSSSHYLYLLYFDVPSFRWRGWREVMRHSSRFLARLVHSAKLQSAHVRILSGHAARGLPLPLFPSTLPSRISLMIVLCLLIWPKKHIFLLFIMSKSCLFVLNFSRTWAFDTFCFQLILPILLRKNISLASSFSHNY